MVVLTRYIIWKAPYLSTYRDLKIAPFQHNVEVTKRKPSSFSSVCPTMSTMNYCSPRSIYIIHTYYIYIYGLSSSSALTHQNLQCSTCALYSCRVRRFHHHVQRLVQICISYFLEKLVQVMNTNKRIQSKPSTLLLKKCVRF